MRLPLALALVVLAAPLVSVEASRGAAVEPFVLRVDGEAATGLVGRPVGEPLGLVVIAHGYTHSSESHRTHLAHLAEQGWLAVAMDYRGTGFPLRAGADDTLAATHALLRANPGIRHVVLYSVSMGTAVAAMVLAESDVFDLWVNNEGLSMLHETWAGASILAPASAFAAQAKADIEAECGGTPADAPLCYARRSAALRAGEFAGLRGAVLLHGVNDGIVPYDQGREMVAALRAAGIPSDFWTVLRTDAGTEGTTVTGYTPAGGVGLAGHGSESNDDHVMTALSFGLLDALLAGRLVPSDAEHVFDSNVVVTG